MLAVGLVVHVLSGREIGSRRGFSWAVVAGVAFSTNQMLFFTAVKRTSVVDASLMSTLSPIVVAIVAIPLFGERPARAFRLWSLLAMGGAVFVVLGSSSGPTGDFVGMLMAVGSTVCFAGFFVISKLSRDDLSVVAFLTTVMFTSGLVVSAYVLVAGLSPGSVGTKDLWTALAMAVVPGTLGHVVMTWPLNYVPANVPPLMRLAGPVVSGGLAWVILGEGASLIHWIGGAIIVIGQAGAILSKAGQDLVAEARETGSPVT